MTQQSETRRRIQEIEASSKREHVSVLMNPADRECSPAVHSQNCWCRTETYRFEAHDNLAFVMKQLRELERAAREVMRHTDRDLCPGANDLGRKLDELGGE